MNYLRWGVAAATLLLAAMPAWAAGDAVAGKAVFNKCRICHSLEAGKTMIGPSLHGLFGRKAGSLDDFRYSIAMKNYGVVWDEASLDKYLTDPQTVVKGTKMVFLGLKDPKERADVIAYLKQATK